MFIIIILALAVTYIASGIIFVRKDLFMRVADFFFKSPNSPYLPTENWEAVLLTILWLPLSLLLVGSGLLSWLYEILAWGWKWGSKWAGGFILPSVAQGNVIHTTISEYCCVMGHNSDSPGICKQCNLMLHEVAQQTRAT